MSKLNNSQLQATINSLVSANNRAREARNKIMTHCEAVYGVLPGDVDNDEFIDAVDGGCGSSSGMTPAAFDQSMRDAMQRAGVPMPE